jgi:hypothetical protein
MQFARNNPIISKIRRIAMLDPMSHEYMQVVLVLMISLVGFAIQTYVSKHFR